MPCMTVATTSDGDHSADRCQARTLNDVPYIADKLGTVFIQWETVCTYDRRQRAHSRKGANIVREGAVSKYVHKLAPPKMAERRISTATSWSTRYKMPLWDRDANGEGGVPPHSLLLVDCVGPPAA